MDGCWTGPGCCRCHPNKALGLERRCSWLLSGQDGPDLRGACAWMLWEDLGEVRCQVRGLVWGTLLGKGAPSTLVSPGHLSEWCLAVWMGTREGSSAPASAFWLRGENQRAQPGQVRGAGRVGVLGSSPGRKGTTRKGCLPASPPHRKHTSFIQLPAPGEGVVC